jgi:hypothetical protein
MEQTLQISSRKFQVNQKDYFNLADNRGNYEDMLLSPELKKRIDKGLMDIKEGKGREYSLDELKAKMGL